MKRKHKPPNKKVYSVNAASFSYIAIAFLILLGIILGAFLSKNSAIGKTGFGVYWQEVLTKSAAAKGFLNLFISSFFSSSLLLCTAFILGLCALGMPGHIAVAIFKGAGIGLSMGYVYIQYGIKGLGICALFILPWALLTSFAVVIACREGIRYSFYMIRSILPSGQKFNLWDAFCNYCFKYVFCFIIIFGAALIEAISTIAFSKLFFS